MSFYQEHEKEITTLQLISQIVGKLKLEYAYQEPQWAHVILDITPRGFTTGILGQGEDVFDIEVDLVNSRIVIRTMSGDERVTLADGKAIRTYYEEIMAAAQQLGLELSIHTKPQEMATTIPFEEDASHHHYDADVALEILKWFQFARDTEKAFLAPLRIRKVHPGLFWGTFDVSCIVIYDQSEPFPDDTKVIERAAFDEHMIEFGFWLGDDTDRSPTFFVLPYPFVEGTPLEIDATFPEGSPFDDGLAEYLYEMDDGRSEKEDIIRFFKSSFIRSSEHLEWEDVQHCFNALKMKKNQT
ncbi:DUF5996 family protein [Salinicoccus roseus]|uniref:DUF5996 family protein n=1 Tax=Salinicoccus roseus TaxID=45670 RepID=UPI002301F52D|nr:DUF5996 family protein [Salinicoccus roseus]